ncbi:MAG: hypothetical protein N2689_02855 [Verrucomicrobiae bacterium]|nr:hypothetical protein [Verrucomicrobiae bacterium]
MRHQLGKHWTLLGETYALIPPGGSDANATFHFNGGLQFGLRESLLFSALVGSAAGGRCLNLTGYLGFTANIDPPSPAEQRRCRCSPPR